MKVLTVGSAMIDSIALIAPERVERMSMRNAETSFLLLEEGKKVEAEAISTHCGGGAVNAAIAYARLGLDVAALVKLGQDQRADQILTRLASEKVSTRYAVRDGRLPTGASVLISAHDRNAAVFAFRGANTLIEAADLKTDAFAVDLVHVGSLSTKSAACFPEIVAKAKAQGARLVVNPGVRQLALQSSAFLALLRQIDILSLNRAEAETLVAQIVAKHGEGGAKLNAKSGGPLPELLRRGFTSGSFEISAVRFFAAMLDYGVKQMIVTDGGRGAYAATADGIHYCPVAAGHVAGTAGAGDAFVSTFAAFTTLGSDVAASLQRAALNAGSVIEHADTQSGLLERGELETRHAARSAELAVRTWSL